MNISFLRIAVSVFIAFPFWGSFDCDAQKILVFDRDGNSKRIRFRVHDEIAVRAADTIWISGKIFGIEDSSIIVGDNVIEVSKITAIRYESKSSGAQFLKRSTPKFQVAGFILLAFRGINSVANNDYPVYPQTTLIVAGALIASKPLANLFIHHKYKINEHHRLKVIDLTIR